MSGRFPWLLLCGFLGACRAPAPAAILDSGLRAEILSRMEEDQAARKHWISQDPGSPGRAGLQERVAAIDRANTARMEEIVAAGGWPGRSRVGEDGAHAAWLLVQHADQDPAFQKQCLKLLEQAVQEGEAAPVDFAYLTDRVLTAEGKLQRYGTQLLIREGGLVLQPVEDREHLDQRRAGIGLGPIREYLRQAGQLFHQPVRNE